MEAFQFKRRSQKTKDGRTDGLDGEGDVEEAAAADDDDDDDGMLISGFRRGIPIQVICFDFSLGLPHPFHPSVRGSFPDDDGKEKETGPTTGGGGGGKRRGDRRRPLWWRQTFHSSSVAVLGSKGRRQLREARQAWMEWMEAEEYYRRGLQLNPHQGTPHNQLAVISAYRGQHFDALYSYFRSALVREDFIV